MRGLDYYSRTTWEFVGPLENENATLSGGGRYDYLVEEIGGPPTPGVGLRGGHRAADPRAGGRRRRERRGAGDRRLLRARAGRAARARRRLARRAPRARRRERHRLRRALAQGPAHAGGQERRVDGRGRRRGSRDAPASRERGRTRSPTTRFSTDCRHELARRHVRRPASRARRAGADARRLGGHAAGPRRARLRRPARPHGRDAARDQPRALAGRCRAREGDPQRVRAPGARRGRRAGGRDHQRGDGDRRGRAAGRRARDRVALDAAPVPARRGGRRREPAPALPLARPAHAAHAAEHAPLAHRDLVDPADDGRPRVHRRLDAEHDARDAGGRARLPRARAPAAGPVLRARAVAADLQAALHDRRARPLLPDRDVLAGRGSPRRPAVRVQAARPRAGVRRARGRARRARAGRRRRLRRAGTGAAGTAVPAADLRGRARALRHRQAGPSLRARDPGRDGGDARLGVRRLRGRGDRALPRRAARFLADGAAAARGDREGVGGEGPRVPRLRRRRGALADREVPLRGRARRLPQRARLDGALRRRATRRRSRASSEGCGSTSAGSSSSRPTRISSTG